MRSTAVFVALAVLLPSASVGADARAAAYCVVDDPSPTPLNLRTAPYGRIIGSVRNGTRVTILDRVTDSDGKPWVYLADDAEVPLGWAYKNYVKCD